MKTCLDNSLKAVIWIIKRGFWGEYIADRLQDGDVSGIDFKHTYDVIVIGSGFGGAFAAYSMAKAGFKTLLLEKGSWVKK
jgi:NADPH-dependent 2,4-dienoyl-CoA reductase/sulfur reductase-like enzyme